MVDGSSAEGERVLAEAIDASRDVLGGPLVPRLRRAVSLTVDSTRW